MEKNLFFIRLFQRLDFRFRIEFASWFPPLWPQLAEMPLVAAVVGAVFVGVGAGVCVLVGGAPSGDDALAMSISHALRWKIQWVYLFTDLIVLLLSLSYIPLERIGYSLLTVLLSGQIIGLIQKIPLEKKKEVTYAQESC